jgi:hypothetical protein
MVALLMLVAGVLAVALLGAVTVWSLFKAILWLVFLPFRLLFGLLFGVLTLPFLLVKAVLFLAAVLVSIVVLPVVIVSVLAAAMSLIVPAFPLLCIAFVVWVVIGRSRQYSIVSR